MRSHSISHPVGDDAMVDDASNGRDSVRDTGKQRASDGAQAVAYDAPDSYRKLDEVQIEGPVQENEPKSHYLEKNPFPRRVKSPSVGHRPSQNAPPEEVEDEGPSYAIPDDWVNLDELAVSGPVERLEPTRSSLDETRNREREWREEQRSQRGREVQEDGLAVQPETGTEQRAHVVQVSKLATQIYTLSYLVFFSIMGALARLGLTALTRYPGTPVIFNTIWSNFAGSLIMGFLTEDRMLFRYEWGVPRYDREIERAKQKNRDEESSSENRYAVDLTAAKKAHLATKKTIPLYIGLATGFCGSFTTFSSFVKDVFLALANEMPTPGAANSPAHRNGGYSFMAMLAVIITTVSLSLAGLFIGAHLAIAFERVTPSIPFRLGRKILDPLVVVLGWGSWLGAVLLAVSPPHDAWRGRAVFAIVFGPPGTLVRFYLALYLNGKAASFPLGTFAANVAGTAVLGMAWDIAHAPIGGVVGCQVLQGIEDGFCGCLTTISTWVSELSSLRRRSAWIYGSASVVLSLSLMIAIMGGLRWSEGYSELLCLT